MGKANGTKSESHNDHFHVWVLNDRGNAYFMRKKVYKHRTAAYRKLEYYPGGMILKCLGSPYHECNHSRKEQEAAKTCNHS